ncbi:hypothetical protein BHL85_11175 [Limosilactobacillus reuteri]|nr:restriction endonuclease subunit S [Limosilactobacillus reuteri]OTA45141.1 hypothetical protein BHL74_06505 [Limosilactobacillus reuteri]OTA52349.1 hypothetical protein BHL85_11175 [Limosilactobacillus reuteri]
MSDVKKTPKLRFKGFTDDWEQRKLGDLANFYNGDRGINYPKPSDIVKNGVPFINAGDINQGNVDYHNCKHITKEKFNQLNGAKLRKNDIVYCLRGTIGKNGFINSTEDATIASSLVCIRPFKIMPIFLFQMLNSDVEERQRKMVDEGAAQPNISAANLKKFVIPAPSSSEQQKISNLLNLISKAITLQQRKLDQLNELKKALLQKMLSNGKLKPTLRFKEFSDNWKQYKLGQVAKIVGGGTPSTKNSKYWDGSINWYSPVEINDQVYTANSQRKITEIGLKKSSARLLPVGTVLFTSRAGIGNTAILTKEACTNQGFQSIVPDKDKLDSYFIYSMTAQLKRYGETHGAGSTFIEVSGKEMAKMPIVLPSYSEQLRISSIFSKIDITISTQQNKIDKLNSFKKSLLQNMFI